jgi:voltage-gated sodium channel
MQRHFRAIADYEPLQDAILGLIVFNGLCMGVEAIPELAEINSTWLFWTFAISQLVFVVEIAVRVLAFWPRLGEFFRDSWNTFDFVVVALSLVPAVGGLALTARLLRLLRLLRILSVSDAIRGLIVSRRSFVLGLPVVGVAFLILNYILVLAGVELFGEVSPEHWGDLGRSATSLGGLLVPRRAGSILSQLAEYSPWSLGYAGVFYAVNVGLLANAVLGVLGPGLTRGSRA